MLLFFFGEKKRKTLTCCFQESGRDAIKVNASIDHGLASAHECHGISLQIHGPSEYHSYWEGAHFMNPHIVRECMCIIYIYMYT